MKKANADIEFTGEFFVPGRSGKRIEADHLERYRFACKFAENKSILDIACGMGYAAPMFMKAGARSYDGVDISDRLVEYANHTYGSDCVTFHAGDICSFGKEISYDLITCFETIEHVENYKSALKNLYALLKAGGLLLISSPNRPITSPRARSLEDKPTNAFHSQEFTPEELLSALSDSGFPVSGNGIYGQRQRKEYSSRFKRRIVRLLLGDPNKTRSPVVKPVRHKVPRYFIIAVNKK